MRKHWSLLLCLLTLGMAGCAGQPPDNLGVRDGRLAPCPESPNCVSSQETDEVHGMEPLAIPLPPERAQELLLEVLQEMPRSKIVTTEPGYVRAEFRSRIFRFVDDVEFYFDKEAGLLHYRSASRLGRSDLGVNRDRMVTILGKLLEKMDGEKAGE